MISKRQRRNPKTGGALLRASGFAERKEAPVRCIIAPSILSGLFILFLLVKFSLVLINESLDKVSDLLRVKGDFQDGMNLLVGQQQRTQEKRFQHPAASEDTMVAGLSVQLGFLMLKSFELVLVVSELGLVAFSLGFELFDLRVRRVGHGVDLLVFDFGYKKSPITFYGNRAKQKRFYWFFFSGSTSPNFDQTHSSSFPLSFSERAYSVSDDDTTGIENLEI